MMLEQTIDMALAALEPWLGGRTFDQCWDEYETNGYVIFPAIMTSEEVARQRAALQPWIDADVRGRNVFEGTESNRIYAMLSKDPIFADLITHPLQLAFAEKELGKSCLLSACLAINLHPGETVQPWHMDDEHCRQKMPRKALGVSTFWTIDAMTEDNGATEILPGSHAWGDEKPVGANALSDFFNADDYAHKDDPGYHPDAIKAVMPAGSLMIAKGNLWHRGGANKSGQSRLIVTPQYCPGWMRPLETMLLAVPPEKAAKLPSRVQELLGYSIHEPFMGYVDGMHPRRALHS
ncbi:phytanoyl-CoA dioxygenase family protein [Parasphingorhabdus halotolerans]|uniref:Phytanoyl-CoA dioxygenase family protein n=1 Tax=Parasphingorhabdus halotolerans TaxID=2725558 RepID=A0A6H2DQS0_9SPHN|nr:phytanoyl-CoA dioxygenase family protein [Parasphingorhabdus halotolerans]QJB70111.1 phytanoyl-CoA dioxygenase family protein [Parasphingorhabdus halotolerans]